MIELAYGRAGLSVELPDDRTTVIEPAYVPGLPDQAGALRDAISNPIGTPPLRELVRSDQTVAISVCDITRPMPTATVLPVLLAELTRVPRERITILIATGTHRTNTPEEVEEMLGHDIALSYQVVNHNAFDAAGLERVGDTSEGVPIWLNRRWTGADVRITVGFVEPHFFAGFSGGPKMVAPGLAGFETIMRLHNAAMIGHPNSTWGITEGNPIHDAVRQIARQTRVDFSVDVTINREREITAAFAGDLFEVHKAACRVAKRAAMRPVESAFDVVVTTNSGYPLDMNLYQAVKGISAAAQIVKDGGSIICAAECSDGVPEHGEYRKILTEASSPEALLDLICAPGHNRHDQWQVQIQAQIQRRAEVYLKSTGLTDSEVTAAHLVPIDDIGATVETLLRASGPDARVCVLPEGPQTIPYLEDRGGAPA